MGNGEEIIFEKERIATMSKVSCELMSQMELDKCQIDDDYLMNTMTYRLSASIYSNTVEQRKLTYHFERPSFFDWLFRRKRKVEINVEVKDLLLNPPADNVVRVCITNFTE